jgi:cob(I)alamin adenosyltransferase
VNSTQQINKYNTGLVQIFTGDGRGKTSAALGTVMRASGYGLKSYIVFFLKGIHEGGEYNSLKRLPGIDYAIFGRSDFMGPQYTTQTDLDYAQQALTEAKRVISSGEYDVVMLDEINTASAWKLIDIEDVVELVKSKPQKVELILTGRHADTRLVVLADQVTELVNRKHPFEKGVDARQGIDY